MKWIEKLVRGKAESAEHQIAALNRLTRQNSWSYSRSQEACAISRDVWLSLCMRYMKNPVADGLVNAGIENGKSGVENGKLMSDVPTYSAEDSVFSRAFKVFGEVADQLEKFNKPREGEQAKHIEQMVENIRQRQEMVNILLRSDLTYRKKLDQIHAIGSKTEGRISEYNKFPLLQILESGRAA